ncbi:MAG TPA: alkaline phosphatase D family protein [Vicinamibacterales bacterium]|nr:alkaline phosphatase D family protein [Vicinamibacterales bacterium]
MLIPAMNQQPAFAFDNLWRGRVDRRAFLLGGIAVVAAGALPRARERVRWASDPFTLGVASGDPAHDGVVLWTRLAPDPLNGGGIAEPVEVTWEVGEDAGMRKILRQGRVTASAAAAHSVHAEVEGLDPDRWYWYRFHAADATSPIGRTKTLPKSGADVNRLRFAFASCQHYETGFFTAYRHMCSEDLDLVFHLGDYIYEGPGRDNVVRRHHGPELTTLQHYRERYAQYRLDPDLQAAHASFPWIVTPDDHEVDNNYAGDISENTDPRDLFLARRAAAYQAYYEHMPLRRRSVPAGPDIQLYRQFTYGQLASFFVLDTRQYRTDQPCGDMTKPPCPGTADPAATLLGAAQERWLFEAFDKSRRRWNVLPQQVMVARVDQFPGPEERISMDQWSGYDAGRTRLLELFARRRAANPIVLTGDIHSNWVNDLRVDFRDPKSPTVGTEFVGTSITSGGDGTDLPERLIAVMAENPFVKFYNSQRGYVSCSVTPQRWHADYQVVDFVTRKEGPRRTRASFLVEDGRPGAQRL